jgi:hypothetical protein
MPQKTFTITEKIALSIVANQGIAAIWRLHEGAAEAHRMGFPISAQAILEIAEAAEQAWIDARERLTSRWLTRSHPSVKTLRPGDRRCTRSRLHLP